MLSAVDLRLCSEGEEEREGTGAEGGAAEVEVEVEALASALLAPAVEFEAVEDGSKQPLPPRPTRRWNAAWRALS